MLQELIYTSVPAGLKPGSQGFCTVACTTGMPPNLTKLLETLSGYRHVFLPPDPNVEQNPVSCSHLLLNLGGVPWHILSRTADAGLDYTQRVNKISHHLVLDKVEQQEAGPAAVLTQYPFLTSWNQKPVILPANKKLPAITSQIRVCEQWAKLTGDAGWGGVLAETALTKRPVSIIFRPGMDMLPLIDEAMALVPPELRWQVSFSTYCCNLPNGTGCQWKCILAGSPEMAQARPAANTLVIDLTQPLGTPPAGQLLEAARTGKQREAIVPFAIQGGDSVTAGQKTATDTPAVPQAVADTPVTVGSPPQAQSPFTKPVKSTKDKKKSNDDVSSKGCFWLIIVFFILVTAGLIGGLFWFYSGNLTKEHNVSVQSKNINDLENENKDLKQQLDKASEEKNKLETENAQWRDERNMYDGKLKEKDGYIDRVADYFTLFPQVSLSPVSVNVKDGIPRKEGDQDPLNVLIGFVGTWERKWINENMLSVNVTCSDDTMTCLAGHPVTYPTGNLLLGYPLRLHAQKGDGSGEPIASFDLVVKDNGIFIGRFKDDLWHEFVEKELKRLYDDAKKDDAFKINDKLITWYEANVKDKTFVLDESMLKKIGELGPDAFTSEYADVARWIELRKDYYDGRLELEFIVDVRLKDLADKVRREKP
jgi:cell division protein FtsB